MNFMELDGESSINFATDLTIEETIEFYRTELEAQGIIEQGLYTAITETTFSMVFDGHPDAQGKMLVIQGVDLGDGTTNVNIRFEDI
jgi:hypothetical protein